MSYQENLQQLESTRDELQTRLDIVRLREEVEALEFALDSQDAMQVRRARAEARGEAVESVGTMYNNTATFVDRAQVAKNSVWFSGIVTERYGDGRLVQFLETDTDVAMVTAAARVLQITNPWIDGILSTLTNYVVGADKETQVSPSPGASKVLAAKFQSWVNKMIDQNDWLGNRDREAFLRWRRDGRCFLRICPQDGSEFSLFRFLEPDFVKYPNLTGDLDAYLRTKYRQFDQLAPYNWEFGIQTPSRDIERICGVYAQYPNDWEYLPISEVEYLKANTDVTIKPGLTDLFSVDQFASLGLRLFRSLLGGAKDLARIVTITNYEEGVTKAGVDLMVAGRAPGTPGSVATTTDQQVRQENASNWNADNPIHLHAPKGRQMHHGPLGNSSHPVLLEVHQAAIRALAVRWSAPEYMVSSSAENGNYSSLVVAESPFVRACQAAQFQFSRKSRNYFMKAAWHAYKAGYFRGLPNAETWDTFRAAVQLDMNLPEIASQDAENAAKNADRIKGLIQEGLVAPVTGAAELGYNLAEEISLGAKKSPTMQIQTSSVNRAMESMLEDWRKSR